MEVDFAVLQHVACHLQCDFGCERPWVTWLMLVDQGLNGFDEATRLPDVRSDSRTLAVACSRMCPGAAVRIPQPR